MTVIKFYFWLAVIVVVAFLIWKSYFTSKIKGVTTGVDNIFSSLGLSDIKNF
jgi:hypothetical protein